MEALRALMVSLQFCSLDCAKLLCSCLCLIDVIVELHVVFEKVFNDFVIERQKWIVYVKKAYMIHDLYFVHVVEAFIILN